MQQRKRRRKPLHTPDAYTRIPTQERPLRENLFFLSFLIFFCREMNKSGVDTCARLLCTVFMRRNVHPRCYSFFFGGGNGSAGKKERKKRGKGRKQTGVRHANLLRKRGVGEEERKRKWFMLRDFPPPFLPAWIVCFFRERKSFPKSAQVFFASKTNIQYIPSYSRIRNGRENGEIKKRWFIFYGAHNWKWTSITTF